MIKIIDHSLTVALARWAADELRGVANNPEYPSTRGWRFRNALVDWWHFSSWCCYGRIAFLLFASVTTNACLWVIHRVNRSRDEALAARLIRAAKRYARNPDDLACYLDGGQT